MIPAHKHAAEKGATSNPHDETAPQKKKRLRKRATEVGPGTPLPKGDRGGLDSKLPHTSQNRNFGVKANPCGPPPQLLKILRK